MLIACATKPKLHDTHMSPPLLTVTHDLKWLVCVRDYINEKVRKLKSEDHRNIVKSQALIDGLVEIQQYCEHQLTVACVPFASLLRFEGQTSDPSGCSHLEFVKRRKGPRNPFANGSQQLDKYNIDSGIQSTRRPERLNLPIVRCCCWRCLG